MRVWVSLSKPCQWPLNWGRTLATAVHKNGPSKEYSSTMLLPNPNLLPHDVDPVLAAEIHQRTTVNLYSKQSQRTGKVWTLHDGPPYANGPIHMGHALNKVLKDIINRWKVLNGYRVDYRPGFDCHGLPIEKRALDEAGLRVGQVDTIEVRRLARLTAEKYVNLQTKQFDQLGIMTDWSQRYQTMDQDFVMRQLEVFANIMKKGMIYRRKRPVYYSPSSRTALAEAELEYVDEKCTSIWVALPLVGDLDGLKDVSILVWTTTPWTLPSNQAVAVNKEGEYVIAEDSIRNRKYLMSVRSYQTGVPGLQLSEALQKTYTGDQLVGLKYKAPFNHPHWDYRVIVGDHVSDAVGTGFVHTAPAHGKDDYLALPNWDELFDYVGDDGNFSDDAPEFLRGLNIVQEGNQSIIESLQRTGQLVSSELITHSVPVDWRTRKKVLTRSTPQWFANINMSKIDIQGCLDLVNFVPEAAHESLFSMVVDRKEWCVSRQRAWGVPIPILFLNGDPILDSDVVAFTMSRLREHGIDSWWTLPAISFLPIRFHSQSANITTSRDIMDVWFDSGCSWTSLSKGPADLYLEGSDQHRGWFQSSLLTSVISGKQAPYLQVYTHAFVLDSKGHKMSKSVGNIIAPSDVLDPASDDHIDADSLRFFIALQDCTSNVRLSKLNLKSAQSNVRRFKNTFRWLVGCVNTASRHEIEQSLPTNLVDKWILHRLSDLQNKCEQLYDSHKINQVVEMVLNFQSNEFSAIYAPIVKDTIYADSVHQSRRLQALNVCRKMAHVFANCLSPIIPHLTEEVWTALNENGPSSIFMKQSLERNTKSNFSEADCRKFELFNRMRLSVQQSAAKILDAKSKPSRPQDVCLTISTDCLKSRQAMEDEKDEIVEILGVHALKFSCHSDDLNLMDICEDGWLLKSTHEKVTFKLSILRLQFDRCPRCRKLNSGDEGALCTRCMLVLKTVGANKPSAIRHD